MSSAFIMLLLDELPDGWTLELADPDEWADADDFDHEFDTDPPTPLSDSPTDGRNQPDQPTTRGTSIDRNH